LKQKKLSLLLVFIFIFSLNFNVFAVDNNSKSEPQIYGKAAITVDMQTGEIIYVKDIDKQMYPASTTKLITALHLAENKSKSDKLTYTQGAKVQPTTSLNTNLHPIDVGEVMSAADVMDGLLIYSGNDMAYVIADNVGKDEKDFANKMNDEISKLGLKNTHFVTPNGLHDPNHYTTSYDLSVIARTAFKNDWVRETIAKQKSTIKTSKGTTFVIDNTNKLLGKDGCIGGKTGYTDKAGLCLASLAKEGKKEYILVTAGAKGNHKSEQYNITDALAVYNSLGKE
jgi:D-alanyl-D-alanine carboxypeptidase